MDMIVLRVLLLLLTSRVSSSDTLELGSPVSVDISANDTISGRQAGYGLIRFEGQGDQDGAHDGRVTFGEDSHASRPLKFEDDVAHYQSNVPPNALGSAAENQIHFQDSSSRNSSYLTRRRKNNRLASKDQLHIPYNPMLGPYAAQKKSKKSRVPIPPGPLRAISDALDSIVMNDSKRCVTRMLCEQAAGGMLLSNSSVGLQSIMGLMQYLPMFQKLVSFNVFPLFKSVGILMLAVRTGSTNKNVTECETRYPECPSDPEKRVHYFNHHRGGLFRFFRGKEEHQYTAEEFHNHLIQMGIKPHSSKPIGYLPANHNAGQYGVFQPTANGMQQAYQYPSQAGQYGVYQPTANEVNQYSAQYGLQQSYPYSGKYGVQRPYYQPTKTIPNVRPYNIKKGYSRPYSANAYPSQPGYTAYGAAYPYNRRFNSNANSLRSIAIEEDDSNISNNKIQKRIQNKPEVFADDNFSDATIKWSFPKVQSAEINVHNNGNKIRSGRQLKFPEEGTEQGHEILREAKGFSFPGSQSNRQYSNIFSDIHSNFDSTFATSGYENIIDNIRDTSDNDEVEIVYVVRGNGDPNRPEIVRLRPGEKLH